MPTKLDPAFVRSVTTRNLPDRSEIVVRVRQTVGATDFVVVPDSTLLMRHVSGERSYPRGTNILLGERYVRVDMTENAGGRQKSHQSFGALPCSFRAARRDHPAGLGVGLPSHCRDSAVPAPRTFQRDGIRFRIGDPGSRYHQRSRAWRSHRTVQGARAVQESRV